jgi:hypothetical protein
MKKFKYRLTIAAFTKLLTPGIDYLRRKHATTVRFNSLKVLLAIAVLHDWDIVLYDVILFFLYGKFEGEDVYMEQQPGWEPEGKPAPAATYNDGEQKQSTKAVNHSTAKHYRVGQEYIRDNGNNGTVKVETVDTADNAAVIFTKALDFKAFARHRDFIMGPQSPL